jgi:hypothetical protein
MLHKKMVSIYVSEELVQDLDLRRGNFTRSSYIGSLLLKHLYKKGVKKTQIAQ